MKKIWIYFSLIAYLSFWGCDNDSEYDVDLGDPLADVVYRIDGNYILKDAYSTDTLFNIDGNYIRQGKNKEGEILYLIQNEFIYAGSEAKGKPKYGIFVGWKIYDFNNYKTILRIDGNYLYKDEGYISRPISHYWGEVAFNIDGVFIRQGRNVNGKVLFTRNGNYFYQGEGTGGSVAFHLDGNLIRIGSSPTGSVLFTIQDQYLYKGRSKETISFNISKNYIRKGKATLAIGEDFDFLKTY